MPKKTMNYEQFLKAKIDELCDENEILLGLVEAGKDDRQEMNRLVDENERLTKEIQIASAQKVMNEEWKSYLELLNKTEKEVSNE